MNYVRLAEQRDELSIVDDQFGAPTSAKAISTCLLDIMETQQFNQSDCPWGTYNFQSDPGVSWYDFAQEIFQQAFTLGMINKQMKLNPIPSSEFPTPVNRPANSKLDGMKLYESLGIKPTDWKMDLKVMLENIMDIASNQ